MNLVFCAFLSPCFFFFSGYVSLWEFVCGDFSCAVRPLDCASFHFSICFPLSSTAPHEICKDEHLLSMSWKRASAGETVYNKCPTNATGWLHYVPYTSIVILCLYVYFIHDLCELVIVLMKETWTRNRLAVETAQLAPSSQYYQNVALAAISTEN